jgi:hypothetical protein
MSIGYRADPSSVNRETVRCSELPSTATAGPSPLACQASHVRLPRRIGRAMRFACNLLELFGNGHAVAVRIFCA